MNVPKIVLALFIVQTLCLVVPRATFSQTEALDGVRFTPPRGWTKTPKEGAVVYSSLDQTAKTFCVITIYASTPSAGNASQDFTNEWTKLVVQPFKAEANPKTETETNSDGWQATVGGAEIDESGVKSAAILTVFSGFGKTVSILTIFNDQSYLTQMQAFIDGIKLDKSKTFSNPEPVIQNVDPFPDRPGYQPQKPLSGTLKNTITMADLVGDWDTGAASVQTYVDSSSGNYSGTDTSFFSDRHSINANGSFAYKFTGRASNHTVRETDSGTVTLSGSTIIFKFKARSTYRYQLIAYMTQANGAAILSLIHLGENESGYDAERMRLLCGHGDGVIHCAGGEEWARLPRAK